MFDYIFAYLVYLFGACAVIFGCWMMFYGSKAKYLRDITIIFIAVVILTPIDAYIGEEYLAPAFFISMYEGVFLDGDYGFQRGAAPILALLAVVLIMYHIGRLIYFLASRKLFRK